MSLSSLPTKATALLLLLPSVLLFYADANPHIQSKNDYRLALQSDTGDCSEKSGKLDSEWETSPSTIVNTYVSPVVS